MQVKYYGKLIPGTKVYAAMVKVDGFEFAVPALYARRFATKKQAEQAGQQAAKLVVVHHGEQEQRATGVQMEYKALKAGHRKYVALCREVGETQWMYMTPLGDIAPNWLGDSSWGKLYKTKGEALKAIKAVDFGQPVPLRKSIELQRQICQLEDERTRQARDVGHAREAEQTALHKLSAMRKRSLVLLAIIKAKPASAKQIARLQRELTATRKSYARMARGVKRALGLKNWPRCSGMNFADIPGAMVAQALSKVSRQGQLDRAKANTLRLTGRDTLP